MIDKKYLYIGGGVIVLGALVIWFHNYEANATATANANADAANQTDAELAQLMLQQPLSYAGDSNAGAAVSSPTVDTGSDTLQTLINSILNPSTTASTGGSSTGVSSSASSTTVSNQQNTTASNSIQLPVVSITSPRLNVFNSSGPVTATNTVSGN